jgi:hypothetical protein
MQLIQDKDTFKETKTTHLMTNHTYYEALVEGVFNNIHENVSVYYNITTSQQGCDQ